MNNKNILILVGRSASNINSFTTELRKRLPQEVNVEIAHFEDIIVNIEEKNTSILINDKELKSYDLIYFRRAGAEFIWLAATIALYLDHNNVNYYDTVYGNLGLGTKLHSLVKMSLSGLPVIPTFFCYKDNIVANADRVVDLFGLPMVAKDMYSQRGVGVSLIKSKEDIEKLVADNPGKKFMFQKFIDKKEEYRVLVLKDRIGSYEVKTSTDPLEFRNNVSLGASEHFIDVNEITEEVKYNSLKSSKVLKIEIAGVDVVVDVNNKVWLIEVNRGPGFTYDSDESPEMDSVAKFFVDEITK